MIDIFYAFLVKIGKNNGGKIRGTWVIGGYKYGPIQTRAQMRGMVTLTRTDARTNEGELGPGYREGVGGARLPVLTLVASSFSLHLCYRSSLLVTVDRVCTSNGRSKVFLSFFLSFSLFSFRNEGFFCFFM